MQVSNSSVSAAAAPCVRPHDAASLVQSGRAWIVDVREPDEYRREHVAGSALCPTSVVCPGDFPNAQPGQQTLVLCRSGTRAKRMVEALRAAGRTDAHVVDGGITAWVSAGLPVARDATAPLPIMRQVMITVGVLGLGLTALAAFVSPWWLLGTTALCAGLLFAGVTGHCGLAALLSRAPWNARATGAAKPANTQQSSACASQGCCGGN